MIGVGVIGYGYWGPNLARNISELPDARLVGVCDLSPARLKQVAVRHPAAKTWTSVRDMLADPEVQAVAVATPVSSHFELAMSALKAGRHVLVEKPMASTSEQCERMIDEAAKRGLTLMVDHTFLYTGAVRKIRELIVEGDLGDVQYYDSVRINLGLFQHDVSVLWDLAVHDLSIMDHLVRKRPVAVSATGMAHVAGEPENTAYITLFFPDSLIAHLHVNWLAPVKLRRTLIGGSRKMVVYDDLEATEKVKVYDKGITVADNPEALRKILIGYRTGDMWAPQLDGSEALRSELAHFLRCAQTGEKPISDGPAGLRIVRILEAATRSMAGRGRPEELDLGKAAT